MSVSRAVLAALVASSLAGVVPASAGENGAPRTEAPASLAQPNSCPDPVAAVAHFLRLAPLQVQTFGQLLQAREAALAPLLQEIAVREQRIRELIATGGDPAEIGTLMLQVHQLQQAVAAVQAQFLGGFGAMLNDEQRRAWDQVRMAAHLQPVLPPFVALKLL